VAKRGIDTRRVSTDVRKKIKLRLKFGEPDSGIAELRSWGFFVGFWPLDMLGWLYNLRVAGGVYRHVNS
jgi:hypothetical protein